jgi:hypothetical protein
VLSRAVHAALKVGVGKPARWLFGGASEAMAAAEPSPLAADAGDEPSPQSTPRSAARLDA